MPRLISSSCQVQNVSTDNTARTEDCKQQEEREDGFAEVWFLVYPRFPVNGVGMQRQLVAIAGWQYAQDRYRSVKLYRYRCIEMHDMVCLALYKTSFKLVCAEPLSSAWGWLGPGFHPI